MNRAVLLVLLVDGLAIAFVLAGLGWALCRGAKRLVTEALNGVGLEIDF